MKACAWTRVRDGLRDPASCIRNGLQDPARRIRNGLRDPAPRVRKGLRDPAPRVRDGCRGPDRQLLRARAESALHLRLLRRQTSFRTSRRRHFGTSCPPVSQASPRPSMPCYYCGAWARKPSWQLVDGAGGDAVCVCETCQSLKAELDRFASLLCLAQAQRDSYAVLIALQRLSRVADWLSQRTVTFAACVPNDGALLAGVRERAWCVLRAAWLLCDVWPCQRCASLPKKLCESRAQLRQRLFGCLGCAKSTHPMRRTMHALRMPPAMPRQCYDVTIAQWCNERNNSTTGSEIHPVSETKPSCPASSGAFGERAAAEPALDLHWPQNPVDVAVAAASASTSNTLQRCSRASWRAENDG